MRFLLSFLVAVTATSGIASAQQFAQPPDAPHPAPMIVDRAVVREKLLANRHANLERFRAYVRAGSFPSNTYTPGALNVWRDADGHLCAAATIINASGSTTLVDETARDHNFIRLADVTDGPLMAWILTSGLTQAEIVAIQKPFMGVRPGVGNDDSLVVKIDPTKRQAETARLMKLYREVDASIVKNERASLDAAVERVMQNPVLAAAFVR